MVIIFIKILTICIHDDDGVHNYLDFIIYWDNFSFLMKYLLLYWNFCVKVYYRVVFYEYVKILDFESEIEIIKP